jgi:subtilisin family serine protease
MARKLIGVLVLALAAALPAAASAQFKPSTEGQRYVPGEALVRYAPGTDASERRDLRGAANVDFEDSLSLARTQLVTFKGPVGDAVDRLEDQPGVLYAQPNYLYHALAAAPNDTHFGNLWGLGGTPGVGALPAWDRSLGAGQVIAVVDTGVDLTHPDLAPNLWTGPGGIHGTDLVDDGTTPDDFNLHGSHVAGTAAAVANNALGVAGVAPQAQIMAVRALDAEGSGGSNDIADGIAFAANNGAGVINLSLGGSGSAGDQAMSDAIAFAETKGAVVVAAAGNENNNNDVSPSTPCTLPNPNIICVAAVTNTGARSDFSNYGATTVDVGAPGGDGSGVANQDILSAKPSWASQFADNFQVTPFSPRWTASGTWGPASGGLSQPAPPQSATDSPGGNYLPNTNSQLQKATAVDLTGQRGCRIDYFLRLANIENAVDQDGNLVDSVGVGVITGAGGIGQSFAGNTGTSFERIEQSISAADGRNDVKPTFTFESDGTVEGDGAYIDNFNLLCRGNSYPNTIAGDAAADGGSYTAITGTSMAAPHVAGVAALVRAVDPGVPPSQVVQAIKNGAKPVAGMAGVTVTGGVADAVGAMDAALAMPNQPLPPPPTPLGKPSFGKLSVNNKGLITMVIGGPAGTSGVLTLTANITAARVRVVGRKSFTIGSRRRATVKVKLSRPALKQLRRKRKLAVKAKAALKNAAGQKSSRTATIRLRLVRR